MHGTVRASKLLLMPREPIGLAMARVLMYVKIVRQKAERPLRHFRVNKNNRA
jgi:hypothetical protein